MNNLYAKESAKYWLKQAAFLPFLLLTVNLLMAQCPTSLSGFVYMGEYNGHHYFCSDNNNHDWNDFNNLGLTIQTIELDEVYSKYYQMDLRDLKEGHYTIWITLPKHKPIARQLVIGRL